MHRFCVDSIQFDHNPFAVLCIFLCQEVSVLNEPCKLIDTIYGKWKKIFKLLDVIFFFPFVLLNLIPPEFNVLTSSNIFLKTHYVGTSFLNVFFFFLSWTITAVTKDGHLLVSSCYGFLGLLTELVLMFSVGAGESI